MKHLKKVILAILATIFWIAVWEIGANRVGNTLLFPTPRIVLETLWRLLGDPMFYRVTANSLNNILSGILQAMLLGILLAVLSAKLPPIRTLLLPIMTVIKATPVASFIVLLLIFIGSAKVPMIITFLIVLPVVWTNLDEGLRKKNRQLEEVATVYRMSRWRKLRLLTRPIVRPFFLSACRTSLGLAWKAGIAAEIIALPRHSIGTMISSAKQYLNTEEMFAWTLAVVILSLLIEVGFVSLWRRLEKRGTGKEDLTC